MMRLVIFGIRKTGTGLALVNRSCKPTASTMIAGAELSLR